MSKKKPQNLCVAIYIADTFGENVPDEKLSEFAKEQGYKSAVLIRNYKEYCSMVKLFKSY